MAIVKETPEEHLLRSLQMTATARFIAAKRLRSHEAWSLWAISIASLLLIFVPLFKPFGIQVYLSDPIVNVLQVLAAAVILVFSLLVNGSKFGERAELMHSCALDVNSISRKLEQLMHRHTTVTSLPTLRSEYEGLLEKHENHSDLDFLFAQIQKFPEFYGVKRRTRATAILRRWISYAPYVVLILAEALFIWLMLVNPACDPIRKLSAKPQLLLDSSQQVGSTTCQACQLGADLPKTESQ